MGESETERQDKITLRLTKEIVARQRELNRLRAGKDSFLLGKLSAREAAMLCGTNGETWTKELPRQQGWYWVQSGPHGLPAAVEFFPALMDRRQPSVRYPGKNEFMVVLAADADAEWLGPLSPADAEQLVELCKAATDVLKWMDWWLDSELCECDSYGHICGKTERRREADRLRAVLNPKPEKG